MYLLNSKDALQCSLLIRLVIGNFTAPWSSHLSGEDNDIVCCQEMAVTDKL